MMRSQLIYHGSDLLHERKSSWKVSALESNMAKKPFTLPTILFVRWSRKNVLLSSSSIIFSEVEIPHTRSLNEFARVFRQASFICLLINEKTQHVATVNVGLKKRFKSLRKYYLEVGIQNKYGICYNWFLNSLLERIL